MEQIVIHVKDKKKAKALLELLKALDFVESVDLSLEDEVESGEATEGTRDFFALAGIWKGREIDLGSIRQQAWPRQTI